MNFYKLGLGVLTAVLSFGALAEGGGDRTFALMMERNENIGKIVLSITAVSGQL